MIVKNRKLNNVKLFQLGVSDKEEDLTFVVPQLEFGGISAGQAHISGRDHELGEKKTYYNFDKEESVRCKVVALDSFIKDDLSNLSFVKIDIEGAEYYALRGMEGIILKYLPVILIEVQPYFLKGFEIKEEDFKDYIKYLGYVIYHYDEEHAKLILLEGGFFDANFILIPQKRVETYKHLIN